jgi:sugar lactone lactonase YvrE
MYRLYKILLSLAAVFAVTTYLPQRVQAQAWTNGQPASFVIGQTGFGPNASAATATTLFLPAQAIIDPVSGKVFVSDLYNNRVLRYPSSAAMTNGAAAEAVLGQPDFVSNGINQNLSNSTANTLYDPAGLAIDASGNLWVADELNSRVLRYANAATIASGSAASEVLGEPDFVTDNFDAVSQSFMYWPIGIFCRGTTLWVADWYNSRILRFNNAASKANGANADAVFGQPDFNTGYDATNGIAVPSATQLYYPTQMYVDENDNLWVADQEFQRVVMFPNASTAPSSEAATKVLGQTDFVSDAYGTTASYMYYPTGIYGDGAGNIYVAEYVNSRILIFKNAASLPNGSAASIVLGQTDFVSGGTGTGAGQLDGPELLYMPTTGTSLLVADEINNRIMIWDPLVTLNLALTAFTGRLQENGQALLQWQITGSGGGAGAGGAPAGTFELQYATSDTSSFNTVLSTQPVNPAAQNYSYLQVSPAPGANYYRLKLIAPDGSFTFSQIVTINVSAASTGLNIYPNPAHGSVAVVLPEMGGTAMISVYSSTVTLMQWLVSGAAVNTIDISRWAAGMYTVKVVEGNSTMTSSFIKVN